MTKLYFDNPQGVILIDGVKCDTTMARVEGNFCIQYIPYDDDYAPIICAVNGKGKTRDDALLIRHGKDYIVRFCPKKKTRNAESVTYLQKVLEPKVGATHCLTCHKDDTYKMSIETPDEFITLDTPCKVRDVKFSCIPISSGQLLTVFAKLENGKTYVGVLHYKDDYTLLLDICCDEASAEEDGLRVCDNLRDALNRKCIRKLSFGGECFIEQSRHFENACSHTYIDEIIPYAFVESVYYGDEDYALECLGDSLRDCDIKGVLGSFMGICDCLDYTPYEITLLYSDCDGIYTKTFRFDVSQGKIKKIRLM